jgi:hypothetical protein
MTTLQCLPATTVSCSTSRPPVAAKASSETPDFELSRWDIVDEWGSQSFPASDPPSNW